MARQIDRDKTFFQTRMQNLVAGMLFPSGQGDWFIDKGYAKDYVDNPALSEAANLQAKEDHAFNAFVAAQRRADGRYHDALKSVSLNRHRVDSKLANGESSQIEVMKASPNRKVRKNKPGQGKHIVYFPGADTYYQACFRDITAAAKETGATVHAFNFPGTGASTGKVSDSHDLVNAGIAVVRDLIAQGVHIDDIILQGDCYGSAIAMEVKNEFKKQSGLEVRVIMNNAFSSFEAAVVVMLKSISWLPNVASDFLISFVGSLLKWIGWDVRPENSYNGIMPYQCHIQHDGDQTLRDGTLSEHVREKAAQDDYQDPCPTGFKHARDKLALNHKVQVKPSAKQRLGDKFGRNEYGQVNSHFADLCELEMHDGKTSAYEGVVNQFISESNRYISKHRQDMSHYQAPRFLSSAHEVRDLSAEEREQFGYLEDNLEYVSEKGMYTKPEFDSDNPDLEAQLTF